MADKACELKFKIEAFFILIKVFYLVCSVVAVTFILQETKGLSLYLKVQS